MKLLATLTDNHRQVQIPGFCKRTHLQVFYRIFLTFDADDRVRPETEEEKQLYKLLSDVTQKQASSFVTRWREPSLTVHTIEISGPKSE